VGDYTELGAGCFYGRTELSAVTYLPTQSLLDLEGLEGLEGLKDHLALVPLTTEELDVVRSCGVMRIAARLAQCCGCFPFPLWCDRDRRCVATDGESALSVLARGPILRSIGSHVVTAGGVVELTLAGDDIDSVGAAMTKLPAAPLSLLMLPPPDASAALVWRPDQAKLQAYAGPHGDLSRLAGGFCQLVPERNANGGHLVEDGFVMNLTRASWRELCAAIQAGAPFDVAPDEGLGFALRWHRGH